jgi:hypothetical protein
MPSAEIILQLSPGEIIEWRGRTASSPETAIETVVHGFGGSLMQLHPGAGESVLNRTFAVSLPDQMRAEDLARQLRTVPGVEAAYVKPAGDLP